MRDIYPTLAPKLAPKLAIVAAAAFALSGCGTIQSVFGSHSARMPEVRIPAPVDRESAVAKATEEGRSHLDKGETGLAIEAFRRALSVGAPAAPALNGMGVAFARLGRYELAHRYFEQAAALDPANERYAANLTRLNRSPAFAMRHDGDIAATMIEAGKKQQATAQALASAEPRPGQLTRVSGREYRIQTVTPMAAPATRTASSTSQFKPLVRIEFSKPEAFNANANANVSANASGKATIRNPHLGKTAAIDAGFKPIIRFPLRKSGPVERSD